MTSPVPKSCCEVQPNPSYYTAEFVLHIFFFFRDIIMTVDFLLNSEFVWLCGLLHFCIIQIISFQKRQPVK